MLKTKERMTVRNEKEIRPIDTDCLLAITVTDYLCHFYIENEDVFTCSKSLKEVSSLLPDFFIQISRNCIINGKKIKSINTKKKVVILSEELQFHYSCKLAKLL
jgi:DNA-binding LytR/AlgR family response regulator